MPEKDSGTTDMAMSPLRQARRIRRGSNGYFELADSAGQIPSLGATSHLLPGGRRGQRSLLCSALAMSAGKTGQLKMKTAVVP